MINCKGALQVIDYSENFVRALADTKKRPKFGQPVPFRFGVRLEEQDDQVVVVAVSKGSVAANAGVQKGDVIVEFGDQAVTKRREVSRMVRKLKGQEINVKLMRDEKEIKMLSLIHISEPTRPY